MWSAEGWRIFQDKVTWAKAQGLDTVPVGEAIARLGESFVGTPYRAGTLEAPGPEQVIVNLHELDCVTFVETVIALTRFVRRDGVAALGDSTAAQARYEGYLREIRYRAGRVEGYASRLHYFSDWLAENAAQGHVEIVTVSLGGVVDPRPITFMTGHAGSYPALSDSVTLVMIQLVETRLNGGPPRYVIPKDSIGGIVHGIRDGDIIAAATARLAALEPPPFSNCMNVTGYVPAARLIVYNVSEAPRRPMYTSAHSMPRASISGTQHSWASLPNRITDRRKVSRSFRRPPLAHVSIHRSGWRRSNSSQYAR